MGCLLLCKTKGMLGMPTAQVSKDQQRCGMAGWCAREPPGETGGWPVSTEHTRRCALYPLLLHIRTSRSHLRQGHLSGTPPTPPAVHYHTCVHICTPSQPLSRAATTRNTNRALRPAQSWCLSCRTDTQAHTGRCVRARQRTLGLDRRDTRCRQTQVIFPNTDAGRTTGDQLLTQGSSLLHKTTARCGGWRLEGRVHRQPAQSKPVPAKGCCRAGSSLQVQHTATLRANGGDSMQDKRRMLACAGDIQWGSHSTTPTFNLAR